MTVPRVCYESHCIDHEVVFLSKCCDTSLELNENLKNRVLWIMDTQLTTDHRIKMKQLANAIAFAYMFQPRDKFLTIKWHH